jgi:hypothetical protein
LRVTSRGLGDVYKRQGPFPPKGHPSRTRYFAKLALQNFLLNGNYGNKIVSEI